MAHSCLAQIGGTRHDAHMKIFAVLAVIALSGCGAPRNDTVGDVTRSEAQALNDAATMLDNNAVAPVVVTENAAPH
ncbi:hypothetical protein BH09PSE3_BH09PSE3_00630 [soil metagenome]